MICNCFLIAHLVSDDHSRVKLENSENDYINASLVMVEEAQRAYILSQVCTSNNNVNFCIIIRSINLWRIWKRIYTISLWWFFIIFFTFLCHACTGAFEEYLWSFLADDLGAVFQSCHNAQQSYWKGICEYTLAPADNWFLKRMTENYLCSCNILHSEGWSAK